MKIYKNISGTPWEFDSITDYTIFKIRRFFNGDDKKYTPIEKSSVKNRTTENVYVPKAPDPWLLKNYNINTAKAPMKVWNVYMLYNMFGRFNKDYFNNELPEPTMQVIHTFNIFGYFGYSDRCGYLLYDPYIQISDYYLYTEPQFRDLLVHEMIHYYLAYTGKDVKVTHGEEFQKMADEFNKKYRMHITEYINVNEHERRKGTPIILYWWMKLFYCK